MGRLLDTEWGFPTLYFGAAIVLVIALLAVGDGRGPNAFHEEVQAARILLVDRGELGVDSALRSLDPDAVARAEATP
ncbi:MAG TPA: hypothetical protein VN752_10060 [Solirubrobacterales bacterium]|nr:hypothetical protein [Solirubrobacterales bacterium]